MTSTSERFLAIPASAAVCRATDRTGGDLKMKFISMKINDLVRFEFQTVSPFSGRDEIRKKILENSALVVQEGEKYYGVLSARDLVSKSYTLIVDCLTEKPVVGCNCEIFQALELMKEHKTDVLAVYCENKLKGLLLKDDVIEFLKGYNSELESKIEERNRELHKLDGNLQEIVQRKTIELQELLKSKDIFLSVIAHDLKNSFSALLGLSELVLKNLYTYDISKIESQVKLIHNTALNTHILLEDLLLWLITISGKMQCNPERLMLGKVCSDVLKDLSVNLEAKNIDISFSEGEQVIVAADLNMLKIILRNLFSNAIKFTEENGFINICTETANDCAIVVISDNGVGMSDETKSRLWDVSKLYSTAGTNGERGTGLGLLLCRQFVERNCGKIWAESEIGNGSKFKFTLPLWKG